MTTMIGSWLRCLPVLWLVCLPACYDGGGNSCPDASLPVEVYFSPSGGIQQALIGLIDKAQSNVDAAIYIFTSEPLAARVVAAHERGVAVRLVVDADACDSVTGSRCDQLEQSGVLLHRRSGWGLMHNKFAVFDGRILVTGSANWSAAAENDNAENILIIEDQDVARIYLAEFEDLYGG